MSRVALLDVNVLVALFDSSHVHHEVAHDWFADHRAQGWATCPHTENGFVRVLANPAYGLERLRARGWAGRHWSPAIAAEALATRHAAALAD